MNQHIRDLAKTLALHPPRVVFPEGNNHIIQQAARALEESGAVQPVLLDGEDDAISRGATMLNSGEADVMVAEMICNLVLYCIFFCTRAF